MDSSEYFTRRAWDCHHLIARSADERAAFMTRESERAFVARAIGAGVPPKTLPPIESSASERPYD